MMKHLHVFALCAALGTANAQDMIGLFEQSPDWTATDINGKMGTFRDIYGRDAPVTAAFSAPRKPWDGKRKSSEKVIKLDNPL